MKYSMQKKGHVVVIELHDHLVGGPDASELKDTVTAELGRHERKFLIDLNGAKVVNSGGIGNLVAVLTSIRREGGELKLCSVSDRARRSFVVTGVWSIFDADYEDQAAALGSFA